MLTEKDLLAQDETQYMSDEQLAFFQKRLLEKTKLLRERIEAGDRSVDWTQAADSTDAATAAEMSRTLQGVANAAGRELERVTRALNMISSGEYGYCAETGEEIGLSRLLLVPESIYTVESMRAIEAKDAHRRTAV